MSLVRTVYDAKLEINVGSTKVLQIVVEDPETGDPLPLTDEDVYNTGLFVITKPDKTVVASVAITYSDRPNGVIEFLIDATITTLANAGNWTGTAQFINVNSLVIDQRVINFNILA